jgi:hypothetical protein
MSRLDSFIRRMTAQRDLLNLAARDSALPQGAVLEIGLGNGRTYSHIRALFPDRHIIAFDRALKAHSGCTPAPQDLILGEIEETGQAFVGKGAALVHADIGSGHDDLDALTLRWLPGLVAGLLAPGGLAVSGLPLRAEGLVPLALPDSIDPDRYYIYRRT